MSTVPLGVPFVSGANVLTKDMPKHYPVYVTNFSGLITQDIEDFVHAFIDFMVHGVHKSKSFNANFPSDHYDQELDLEASVASYRYFFEPFVHSFHLVFTSYSPHSDVGGDLPLSLDNDQYRSLVCDDLSAELVSDLSDIAETEQKSKMWYLKPSFSDSQLTNIIGIRDMDTLSLSPVELIILKDTASCTDYSKTGLNLTEFYIKRQLFSELMRLLRYYSYYNHISVSHYHYARHRNSHFKMLAMDEYYYKTTGKVLRMRYSDQPNKKKSKEYRAYTKYLKTTYDDLRAICTIIQETKTHTQTLMFSANRLKGLIEKSSLSNTNADYLNMSIPAYDRAVAQIADEVLIVAQKSHELALNAGAKLLTNPLTGERN